jgi:arginase
LKNKRSTVIAKLLTCLSKVCNLFSVALMFHIFIQPERFFLNVRRFSSSSAFFSSSASSSSLSTTRRRCAIIGAPFSWGQPKAGTDLAPSLFRNSSLVTSIESLKWNTIDLGDVIYTENTFEEKIDKSTVIKNGLIPGLKNQVQVGQGNLAICNAVKNASRENDFVLTLGGDHSIALGSISGILARSQINKKNIPIDIEGIQKNKSSIIQPQHTGPADLAVLWIDAHADINDPITSPSGNIHGMPLSFLLRLFDPTRVEGFEWLTQIPMLNKERLCYIGLRDLDQGEKEFIKKLGIKAFTMQDIDRHGIGKVMELAIEHIQRKLPGMSYAVPIPLHLSFDIDSIDPSVAPSTGTRVKGGLSYREAHYVCEAAAETGLLQSMDMVEVNPNLGNKDEANTTINLAIELVQSALGKSII